MSLQSSKLTEEQKQQAKLQYFNNKLKGVEEEVSDEEEPLYPQPGKQELALNIECDVIFFGGAAGSAKTFTALMRSLKHVCDKNYRAIYFRRITSQLEGAGGLWSEAKNMYRRFGVKTRQNPNKITFPKMDKDFNILPGSGAEISFSHMQLESDKDAHLGLQYSAIFFDELPTFEESQFLFLMSRLRSSAKMSPFMFCTMNPDYDSWVFKWVEWYLDEEGFPDPEKCGVIRYFLTIDGKQVFRDTREDLEQEFPELCWVKSDKGEVRYVPPKSFTFIGATIHDNQKLITTQPEYLASLMAQDKVQRDRFLFGNWKARAEGNSYFKREWLKEVDTIPLNAIHVRAWDKAASEPCEKEWKPDYTACSPRMSRCKDGYYWLYWGVHEDVKDPKTDVTGRFRKLPGDRDELIEKQAIHDGRDVAIILAQDIAQAGKVEWELAAKKLIGKGFTVLKDPSSSNARKLTKFQPFSSACQAGIVRIVKSSFPNRETYEDYMKELEGFDGEKSTRSKHDDWADATASGFNALAQRIYCPVVIINQQDIPSLTNDVLYTRDLYNDNYYASQD